MTPSGCVVVDGTQYSARSQHGFIEKGHEVIVIDGDHGGLVVVPVEASVDYDSMTRRGQIVYTSFGELIAARTARGKVARQKWLAERRCYVRNWGPVLGAIFSIVGIAIVWRHLVNLGTFGLIASCGGILLVGMTWSTTFLLLVDYALQKFDESFYRLTTATTCLGLVGSTLGAAYAIPAFGWVVGIVMALIATLLFASPVPILGLFVSASPEESIKSVEVGGFSSGETVNPAVAIDGGEKVDGNA
jgi:hypothetical protein